MKSFCFCLGILLSLQVYSLNIDNQEKDGFPIIIPEVKKCIRTDEEFVLPKTLSVSAPEKLGLKGLEKTFSERGGGKIERSDKGVVRFLLTDKDVPDNREGYTLEVKRSGITICARELPGLHCGMQSLRWMLRNTRGNALKGCKITDFPDLAVRAMLLELQGLRPAQVDELCQAIEIYGLLKYNTASISFEGNFPLKGNPLTRRKFTLSLSDIQKIKQACAENLIEIIPSVQAISHTMWMTFHPEYDEKISEGKPRVLWDSAYCLSKPLPEKLMKQYLTEMSDLFKPRYLAVVMDELWACPFQVCPECKKQDPVELFGNHAKMLLDLLLDRGIIPIIPCDTFLKDYPEFPDSRVTEALKKFDRRVIISMWDYKINSNERAYKYFSDLGFKTAIYSSYSLTLPNVWRLPRIAVKNGAIGCVLTWWDAFSARLARRVAPDIFAALILGADAAWNISDRPLPERAYDPVFEAKRLLDSPKILDYGNCAGTEIPLNRAVNSRLGQNRFFPLLDAAGIAELKKELASRKEKFRLIADKNNYFGIVLSGGKADSFPDGEVEIPVGRNVKGLSFLMTAAAFNDFLVALRIKPVIGELKINYEDRQAVAIPLTYRDNINSWNSECGAYNL
ncbi:MAG: glycoside hydrolase family 20 zincin-like fold domain-containing protein, partial [Victivallales bacterium]|nr:glycoside hydrolase family 20 zincin-like fold domain-containing protein [Victivallales bacterium]